jgi:ABC-2 type transport system ATP-binding protein
VKAYGDFLAVDRLSFEVHAGEVFGLLGPNGAGKTTTIRMLMDIFRPDAGTVRVLGTSPAAARERVGYLPEDRGLYANLKVLDTLVYLAELKGADRDSARLRGRDWLGRVGLLEWEGHKVQDLSRGMRQKLQFVASLIHDPELLILDEPFQGLDPVNVDLIRRLVRDLSAAGKTIVLSAHQMNLVEALCDRIVLINHGRAVLYGRIDEIKATHAPLAVRIRTSARLDSLPNVARLDSHGSTYVATLEPGASPQALLEHLVAAGVEIRAFEVAAAPLEDIFIAVVAGDALPAPRFDGAHAEGG